MARLTGSKRAVAIAAAAFLVTAVSGTALAMLDPGLVSLSTQSTQRQAEQRPSTFESPAPTPERSNEVEFRGTVESMATTGWVVSGRAVIVTGQTELKGSIGIGSQVKVEGSILPDGSVQAREIHLIAAGDDNDNGNGNENENENHNGNMNSNDNDDDDNGNGNGNDDAGNGNMNSNDNDDDGSGNMNSNGNDNDDDGNGNGNSNDDDGNGNMNSNGNDDDDNGNDDDGNSNDNGDDHGGNGNDHDDDGNGNDDEGGDDHGGNGNGDD